MARIRWITRTSMIVGAMTFLSATMMSVPEERSVAALTYIDCGNKNRNSRLLHSALEHPLSICANVGSQVSGTLVPSFSQDANMTKKKMNVWKRRDLVFSSLPKTAKRSAGI